MPIVLVGYTEHREEPLCADGGVAFDDQTSTFIIPSGGGFEVIFCPPGRSSTILATMAAQLHQLAQTGQVSTQMIAEAKNKTVVKKNGGLVSATSSQGVVLALAVTAAFFLWV